MFPTDHLEPLQSGIQPRIDRERYVTESCECNTIDEVRRDAEFVPRRVATADDERSDACQDVRMGWWLAATHVGSLAVIRF